MAWDVEFTDEFEEWWESLNEDEQEAVAASVGLLEAMGPRLSYPLQQRDSRLSPWPHT
jgi:hypothetical protein